MQRSQSMESSGAFAFTLSVPLILIGNGVGAFVVRELAARGVDQIRKFCYLKNGAMYSILVLGTIMLADSFGFRIPAWLSPIATFIIVGFFPLPLGAATEERSGG